MLKLVSSMASGGFYGRVDNPNDRPPKHAFPGSIAFQQLDPIVEEGIIDEQRTNWHQRNAILLSVRLRPRTFSSYPAVPTCISPRSIAQ